MRRRPSIRDSDFTRLRTDLEQTRRQLSQAQQRVRELEAQHAGWPFASAHLERLHTAMTWLALAADPTSGNTIDGSGHSPNHDSTRIEGSSTAWARAAKRRVTRRINSLADYTEAAVSGEENTPREPRVRCTTSECRRYLTAGDGKWRNEWCPSCGGRLSREDADDQIVDAGNAA